MQRLKSFFVHGVFLIVAAFVSAGADAQSGRDMSGHDMSGHDKDAVDLAVVQRIKTEAFDHSQVMDTLSLLTDRYGPRLTGSP